MKRSEALTIISVEIDEELTTTAMAENILKALEEAGIYPPCRRDGKYQWEPENGNQSNSDNA